MTDHGEAIAERLAQLGFTQYEARTYLGLLQTDTATGYSIANETGVPQPKVYETLRRLVERGAAARTGEKPARYRAVPPDALLKGIEKDFAARVAAAPTTSSHSRAARPLRSSCRSLGWSHSLRRWRQPQRRSLRRELASISAGTTTSCPGCGLRSARPRRPASSSWWCTSASSPSHLRPARSFVTRAPTERSTDRGTRAIWPLRSTPGGRCGASLATARSGTSSPASQRSSRVSSRHISATTCSSSESSRTCRRSSSGGTALDSSSSITCPGRASAAVPIMLRRPAEVPAMIGALPPWSPATTAE